MKADKNLILDLSKCQWATLAWVTKDGYRRACEPKGYTVHGSDIEPEAIHMTERCTMLEYALTHDLLDKWYPICVFQLSSNHTVTFTKDKAIIMYDAWKAKIFSGIHKKKKK